MAQQLIGPDPQKVDSALYIFISFISINGGAVEEGRMHQALRDLEQRGRELIDNLKHLEVPGLTLYRRAMPTYSAYLWRAASLNRKQFSTLKDAEIAETLEGLPEDTRELLDAIDFELQFVNANLKVGWTLYQQVVELAQRNFDYQTDEIEPNQLDRLLGNGLEKSA